MNSEEVINTAITLAETSAKNAYETIKNATTKEEFISLTNSIVAEDHTDKAKYEDGSAVTYEKATYSSMPNIVSEYLYNDERKTGDLTMINDESGNYYIVYFINKYLDKTNTRDMRFILDMYD